MKRKSPVRHRVRQHTRKNRPVREYARGKGINPNLVKKKKMTERVIKGDPRYRKLRKALLEKGFEIITRYQDKRAYGYRYKIEVRLAKRLPSKSIYEQPELTRKQQKEIGKIVERVIPEAGCELFPFTARRITCEWEWRTKKE